MGIIHGPQMSGMPGQNDKIENESHESYGEKVSEAKIGEETLKVFRKASGDDYIFTYTIDGKLVAPDTAKEYKKLLKPVDKEIRPGKLLIQHLDGTFEEVRTGTESSDYDRDRHNNND